MLKGIAVVVVLVVTGLFGWAATRPDTFRLERSITIKAPPEKIYAQIVDFRLWGAWSPWDKIDPAQKREFGGPAQGKGASYAWQGNREVGKGRMEIIDTTQAALVKIKIDFIEPMEGHNTIDFTLKPEGESTRVTQAMFGPSPLISRLMSLVFDMEKMVGPKFEEGLINLKTIAERSN